MKKNTPAFTLIELLLVIGIIAILAVAVFVALDPAKRFADSRNARRTSDVETILSAVHQYVIDNKGAFPDPLNSGNEMMIGEGTSGCANTNGGCNSPSDSSCVNLDSWLVHYLKTMPVDPGNGTPANTQYDIVKDSNNMVTVTACQAEGTVIQASE